MENKLLPCPFCGGNKVRISRSEGMNYEPYYFVYCHKCAAEGPFKSIESEAITAWNTRSRPEAVKRLMEAAKEFLRVICSNTIQNNESLKAINALKAVLEGEKGAQETSCQATHE